MATVDYNLTSFPNEKVNLTTLEQEAQAINVLNIIYTSVTLVNGDTVRFTLQQSPDTEQTNKLNQLVAEHQGLDETVYTYSITETSNNKIATDSFHVNIVSSTIKSAIKDVVADGVNFRAVFKSELDSSDKTTLDNLVANHDGVSIPLQAPSVKLSAHTQNDSALRVAVVGREGDEQVRCSHDFARPYTWFGDSVRITSQSLSQSNDNTWHFPHKNIINLTHGYVFNEEADILREPNGHGYSLEIFSGSVKLQEAPIYTKNFSRGGDYYLNYSDGTLTTSKRYPSGSLFSNYSYENGSTWTLKPEPGEYISIESAEVQFSEDVILNDNINFETWGFVAAFAPDLAQSNGGPLPDTMKIKLGEKKYKRFTQLIDDSRGAYPTVPAVGGKERGMTKPIYGFPFTYQAARRLLSSAGMELRVKMEENYAAEGDHATVTLYTVAGSESEL